MGPVRNALRLTLPLLLAIAAVAVAVSVVTTRTTRSWFEAELTTRARLAASSARQAILEAQLQGNGAQLTRLLDDLLRDDRVVAAAICATNDELLARTALYPLGELSCREVHARTATDADGAAGTRSSVVSLNGDEGPLHISLTPILDASGPRAELVVVQDFAQVHQRQELVRNWALAILGTLALASSLLTILSARLTSIGWVRQLTRALRGERERWRDDSPLLENVRALAQRTTAAALEGDRDGRWTRERLRSALIEHLDEDGLVIVANREPYIHVKHADGHIEVQHPASGLVTALEPVMRACSGVWIAHGSGSGDREMSDANGRLHVPPGERSYVLRRVWMTEEEEQGYYYGMANEGLWPLCHLAYARPIFRADDWAAYREINARFADAVADEVTVEDPIVLVQDYHFALAPRLIRDRLPRATIITFWHIPWPNAERFGVFPWREEILDGLLGSSIVGFHTQAHCNHFIDGVDTYIEARIDRVNNATVRRGARTLVRPYPISVEWPLRLTDGLPPADECRREVLAELGLPEDTILAVGVDRLDYTKGIEERVEAVERLLERRPDLIGRFVFVQLAAPSRTQIPRYRQLHEAVESSVQRINERFGTDGYQPVRFLREHHEPERVFRYYRAANVCYVSSLHDGMNLVSKEFVAARNDEQGVLVLSQFAGAAQELTEALIVNPYDLEEASGALERAAFMPRPEQADRMRTLRAVVAENNVYRWAGRMLLDAAQLRHRARRSLQLSVEHPAGVA